MNAPNISKKIYTQLSELILKNKQALLILTVVMMVKVINKQ